MIVRAKFVLLIAVLIATFGVSATGLAQDTETAEDNGWVLTWGGAGCMSMDLSTAIDTDSDGNIYVVGHSTPPCDVDPGPGTTIPDSDSVWYLSKFNASGIFQWSINPDAVNDDSSGDFSTAYGGDIEVSNSGNIYITGFFEGEIDFDPGEGTSRKSSLGPGEDSDDNEAGDAFLCKYNSTGALQWVRTLGGPGIALGLGLAVDENEMIYMTGSFSETVEFEDGEGTEIHSAVVPDPESELMEWEIPCDAFLCNYSRSGDLIWVRTWGGTSIDGGIGIVVPDDSDRIYVTGMFNKEVDFDPGDGFDLRSSNDELPPEMLNDWGELNVVGDAFLTSFDRSGNYLWTCTWGGLFLDAGMGVTCQVARSSQSIYVTGFTTSTTFFADTDISASNPAIEEEEYSNYSLLPFMPNGPRAHADAFLSKFNADGKCAWTRTWGGALNDYATRVVYDRGNLFVAGQMEDRAFVTRFDYQGNQIWESSPEGDGRSCALGIAASETGAIYTIGKFWNMIDFCPGNRIENRIPNGDMDIYLLKLLPDGTW